MGGYRHLVTRLCLGSVTVPTGIVRTAHCVAPRRMSAATLEGERVAAAL
jgi:hypothetical protein